MTSSEQEAPRAVVKTDINASVKGSTVENTSDESPLAGGGLTENMDDSDMDTIDREEEEGVAEKDTTEVSESGQDSAKWMSSLAASYAIQCNDCYKWRIMPSKEKYQAIGEHILEQPFVCADAQDWKRDINCDTPADVDENKPGVLWAIDKHNLPVPPKGFYRKVVLRAKNAKQKFADTYYKTPCGKTLCSGVQVQRYLDEHPEIDAKLSQFSFTSPKGRGVPLRTGVSSKRAMKDGLKPRKRLKGSSPNPEPMRVKAPGHGQPPRPRPLPGTGTQVKSGSLSASKSSASRQD